MSKPPTKRSQRAASSKPIADLADADRVRRILSRGHHVAEKTMMGGLVFMVDGHMCCALSRGKLMVRVGREARAALLALPHVEPMGFGGRQPIGFIRVAPAGYRTDAALATWIERGLAFVATLPAKKPAANKVLLRTAKPRL